MFVLWNTDSVEESHEHRTVMFRLAVASVRDGIIKISASPSLSLSLSLQTVSSSPSQK